MDFKDAVVLVVSEVFLGNVKGCVGESFVMATSYIANEEDVNTIIIVRVGPLVRQKKAICSLFDIALIVFMRKLNTSPKDMFAIRDLLLRPRLQPAPQLHLPSHPLLVGKSTAGRRNPVKWR